MNNARPILIFGTTGQLGRALAACFGSRAVCVGRDEADFTQPECFAPLIERINPAAIINAVAYTQVDKAEHERDLAYAVNATAPGILAGIAKERCIPFVHYSTDYVFDGAGDKAFTETDMTAPLNVYGESKRAGESAVMRTGGDYLIFRTSWVYDAAGANFFNTMLRLGAERTELRVVADQIGAPSYAPHLAQATMEALILATHLPEFPHGIYHMCNQGETSWHGFACEIFEQAENADMPLMITSCESIPGSAYPTPAKRPHNSRLDCSALNAIFDITLPHWKAGVTDAIQQKGQR